MKRIFTYNIDCPQGETTILDYLKSLRYSQGLIAQLKKTPQGIMKNHNWAYVRDTLTSGDVLTITLIEHTPSEQILPVELPLDIIYEDLDLMVINKPANMPIHPSQGNYDNTLANALAWHYKKENRPFVYRCINRLDRDTTGLLILAKNAYSAALLSHMVSQKLIHREYQAIVTGLIEECGSVNAPIGRVDGSTIERGIDDINGDSATTHYQRLAYNAQNGHSLVSLQLETGRTHQIRVHMKYIGHPLPGDFLYNPDYSLINRQALHSYKLSLEHPITGEPLSFTCPLPTDMKLLFPSIY